MTKTEVNQIIADALNCSVRSIEGWRSKPKQSPTQTLASLALQSLDAGGTPVKVGDHLEIILKQLECPSGPSSQNPLTYR